MRCKRCLRQVKLMKVEFERAPKPIGSKVPQCVTVARKALLDEHRAEPFAFGSMYCRTAELPPRELQLPVATIAETFPTNMNPTAAVRERSIFSCVGGELVHA